MDTHLQGPPASRGTDPVTSHRAEAALNASGRRDSQKGLILSRLMQGPATNVELAALALKYTSRLSDIRADGWRIDAELRPDGRTIYRLGRFTPPPPTAEKGWMF